MVIWSWRVISSFHSRLCPFWCCLCFILFVLFHFFSVWNYFSCCNDDGTLQKRQQQGKAPTGRSWWLPWLNIGIARGGGIQKKLQQHCWKHQHKQQSKGGQWWWLEIWFFLFLLGRRWRGVICLFQLRPMNDKIETNSLPAVPPNPSHRPTYNTTAGMEKGTLEIGTSAAPLIWQAH